MIIYLAGIFMGAIDTGIVTPARTVIQSNLGVNEQTGIWMITIYTLAYATSIPIIMKYPKHQIDIFNFLSHKYLFNFIPKYILVPFLFLWLYRIPLLTTYFLIC